MSTLKIETEFISVDPIKEDFQKIQNLLLGGVAPRPIALVSTISEDGINNLSPFSFFNAFGANPPIVAFSSSLRGRDSTPKDTLNNLKTIGECVIQSVSYEMVEQISLSSTEYDADVDEFVKSGLTPIPSDFVQPMRVKESPFQMECVVKQIIPLGDKRASGNLVICEVVKFHYHKEIMKNGIIEPNLIDLVGRNSANYYTRASGNSIFKVEKPIGKKGIGFDNLPEFIKNSHILSANNLAQLANRETIPGEKEIDKFIDSINITDLSETDIYAIFKSNNYHKMLIAAIVSWKNKNEKSFEYLELAAKAALDNNDVTTAWILLLILDR